MTKSIAPSTARRSPGEGSIYAYGSRFRGAVAWTDPDGTRHRRVVTGATKAEARARLDDLRRELRLGTLSDGPAATVGEYLSGWIERHRADVRPSTWLTAEGYVTNYLIPALGRRSLVRLSATDVSNALAAFMRDGRPDGRGRGPISALTARHIRATLRRALSDARRDGLVGRNVASDAPPPRLTTKPIAYLSRREVVKFIAATADSDLGPLYALAVTTGLRRGELLGLTWADVEDGRVAVRRSVGRISKSEWGIGEVKSAKSIRTLPLAATARQAVETQRTRQLFAKQAAGTAWQDTEGRVFTDSIGRPLQPVHVSHRFAKDIARAGVHRVRFHDLRHSAATALLAEGIPMAAIAEWLGHESITTTASLYAAVTPELLNDARDAMDRALTGGAS